MTVEKDQELQDIRGIITHLENELTRFSLTTKNQNCKESVRLCVYHVILKAIALSKDPKNDTNEIMRLYQLAQEIIANADLDNEGELNDRLKDLINSMVEQDDLNIQFKYFRVQTTDLFRTIQGSMRREFALASEENANLQESVNNIRIQLAGLAKKKSKFKIFMYAIIAVSILVFTITSSVVIIAALSNSGSSSFEKSSNRNFIEQSPRPMLNRASE